MFFRIKYDFFRIKYDFIRLYTTLYDFIRLFIHGAKPKAAVAEQTLPPVKYAPRWAASRSVNSKGVEGNLQKLRILQRDRVAHFNVMHIHQL